MKKCHTEETLIQIPAKTKIRQHPSLVVLRGEEIGRRMPLVKLPVTVGRDENASPRFHHASVSRQHCQITRIGDDVYIRDLGATNTTRVNQKQIDKQKLSDGDLIAIGQVLLKYLGPDSIESEYHETLYQLATQDVLCGIANRRYFMEQLSREVNRSVRHGNPFCLIMLDIDHFKQVNDQYGHAAGDKVLLEFSKCLIKETTADDLCARIGGEEFAILLPESRSAETSEFASQLRKTIALLKVEYKSLVIKITASMGLVSWKPGYNDAEEILNAADRLLYKAKGRGRNCVVTEHN